MARIKSSNLPDSSDFKSLIKSYNELVNINNKFTSKFLFCLFYYFYTHFSVKTFELKGNIKTLGVCTVGKNFINRFLIRSKTLHCFSQSLSISNRVKARVWPYSWRSLKNKIFSMNNLIYYTSRQE